MTVAGTFNGWNQAANNMALVGNHLWRSEMTFSNVAAAEFKVAANGTWAVAWGDPAQSSPGISLRGKGDSSPGAANIQAGDTLSGVYRFMFHDLSARYSLDYAPQYIVMRPGALSDVTTGGLVLRWLSSTDCRYSVGLVSNLGGSAAMVASNLPATPPLNTRTQIVSGGSGRYFIRLDP